MQPSIPLRAQSLAADRPSQLSYKFQRLRERLRAAILNGTFQEKLPGERELGRRFNVNAKTVNKALSDLASEGLLIRHIGRGTFLAGSPQASAPSPPAVLRCLRAVAPQSTSSSTQLVEELCRAAALRGLTLDDLPVRLAAAGEVRLADWPSHTRRFTGALICIPQSPLSGAAGHLNEELILEAYRRHVPVVVMGALRDGPKVNTVVSDYVDAGYRLAEHLIQVGCERVVAAHARQCRESAAVLNGCQAAGTRYGRRLDECCLDLARENEEPQRDPAIIRPLGPGENSEPSGAMTGVLCIGTEALQAVRGDERFMQRWQGGTAALACLLDPGDPTARDLAITAYEVLPGQLARWAVWLAAEARPGQRPLERIIPGTLRIRQSIGSRHKVPVSGPAADAPSSTPAASNKMAGVTI